MFKTAGLLFRMFRVDKTEVKGTMQGAQVQLENGIVLDEEQLLFIAGGQDNIVDEDLDEQPTMFMENLSSTDPVYDEAGPSYDSDILSEEFEFLKLRDIYTFNREVVPLLSENRHRERTGAPNVVLFWQ
nr:hypothetical protein [Tanacetum cinerariifolium]